MKIYNKRLWVIPGIALAAQPETLSASERGSMLFLQDTRSIGLIFWIVVALLLINAAAVIAGTVFEDAVDIPDYVTDRDMYCLLIGAGSLISAAIYGLNAHRVMSKKMTRLEVLHGYVLTVGLCTAAGGVFGGLAEYLYTSDPESGIVITAVTIVLGLIVILISMAIVNGKKGFMKKVIWAILVISFILMLIDALIPADNYWTYAEHIAHLLIAFFMLAFILDSGIRREMGALS